MSLITDGFDTGSSLLPWGITLAEALTQLAEAGPVKLDHVSARFLATRALGFNVLSVTLMAPAIDRPVMQVWYELRHDPGCASDDALVKYISRVLGHPVTQASYNISGRANSPYDVRYVASWRFAGFQPGLSIYGAPRETPEGLSSAALYVDWEDEIAAAAPYMHEMDEMERSLERYARNAEIIASETLEEHQNHYHLVYYNSGQAPPSKALLRAQRCLRKPHLYQTPAVIAGAIKANQVVVWKSAEGNLWCLSTKYETVCFLLGSQAKISHLSLLPAKGSGATTLSASDLELVSIPESPAISRLVALLKENKLAEVSFTEDYDS